ncbi:hypothetical protein MLD38_011778 [Melastoma candidum]|uniref:Uncharacterized protein n=1 Tax=Melastoma candidum TaxID=119954 RepID=A0ACB9R3R8_9MYRT|nr:hypothetical protein MLD38_011778 [Melastoma candidum]
MYRHSKEAQSSDKIDHSQSSLHTTQAGVFDSWSGHNCCRNWYGVTCDPETGSVAEVTLRAVSKEPIFKEDMKPGYMRGIISPSVCQFKNLLILIVTDWKGIEGEIPSCLTSLSSLRIINLASNCLSGMIPKDIGKLSHLTVLDMADNKLMGCIPGSITRLSSLMHMDLRNNLLTGRLPHDFGRLKMLDGALLWEQTNWDHPKFDVKNLWLGRLGSLHEYDLRPDTSVVRQDASTRDTDSRLQLDSRSDTGKSDPF